MSLLEFGARRICLRTLLWSGLLFGSLCDEAPPAEAKTELLVPGSPSIPRLTSTLLSTITVTKTIAYNPSLIPGIPGHTLVGCYSQISEDGVHIFEANEFDASSNAIQQDNPSLDGCLRSCASTSPSSNGPEFYKYAGLRNGSQCICGVQLSSNARKVSADACKGGQDNNIAVYSIISRDNAHRQGMQPGSISPDVNKSTSTTTKQPATNAGKSSPSTETDDTKNKGAAAFQQAANSKETIPVLVGPSAPKKPISASTIAAIAGSLTAAVALAACVILWYRARWNRKHGLVGSQKGGTQVKKSQSLLDKRGRQGRQAVPNPIIMAGPDIHSGIADVPPVPEFRHDHDKDGGRGSISSGTDYRGHNKLLPTTPALESGGRFPADLHARTGASTSTARVATEMRTTMPRGANGPHGPSTGEARAGPTHPRMNAPMGPTVAATGGGRGAERGRDRSREGAHIQTQRPTNNTMTNNRAPLTPPKTPARERAASPRGLATPPPSASTAGLGDRAWHRRKLSTPYQPPAGVGLGLGGPAAGVGRSRENMARRGPPSGPPPGPLPPMPPMKPGARAAAMPQAKTRPSEVLTRNGMETSGNRNSPPARPRRRSFDEVVSEAKPGGADVLDVPAVLRTGTGTGTGMRTGTEIGVGARAGAGAGRGGNGNGNGNDKGNTLGMSHPNASTPTLGRYGSISKRGQQSIAESPTLGWMTVLGGEQWGVPLPPSRRARREEHTLPLANREPKIPVLPPVAPGERFDHRRWEGTIYAQQPYGGQERREEGQGERGRRGGDRDGDWSPSSVGTSILFELEELDRRL
ncbi:hypothetical protein F5Y14DRAFT_363685 [Nemania sp. NC0429]|nr:hypothetical protein F5Y14DRAFT_363685 [Nemania sp. NC0429]